MAKRSSTRAASQRPRKPAKDLELTIKLRQRLDATYHDLERAIREVAQQHPECEKRLRVALAKHESAVADMAFGI